MKIEDRIYQELIHEQAAIWFICDSFGSKIMVKAPSASIKAIMQGCRVDFLFGKDGVLDPPIIHHGIKIHDDPVHFLSITGTHRYPDEHKSLHAIMSRSTTHIHFHNELNICVATAKVSFSVSDQMKVIILLGNLSQLYCGEFGEKASRSLDSFQHSLQMQKNFENAYIIETLIIEASVFDCKEVVNHIVGSNQKNIIIINDLDEGNTFEQEIWAPLDSLFRKDVHRNPKVFEKNKFRELTDIFASYNDGIFLIESKALSVTGSMNKRSMARKVAGVQKQIIKGVSQVVGAWKTLIANGVIYDHSEKKIIFEYLSLNNQALPHCIVLVSELLPFGDWKSIEIKIYEAMIHNRIYLNVMDLKEFMQCIGHARGSKDRLNLILIERVENMVKHQSIHTKLNVLYKNTE